MSNRRATPLKLALVILVALLAVQIPTFVGLAAEPAIASDSFSRSATSGWGTADVGGPYTPENWPSHFSVSGGVGTMLLPNAGANRAETLDDVSIRDVDTRVRVRTDKVAAGNVMYAYLVVRRNGTNAYRPKAIFYPNGTVAVHSGVLINNSEQSIAPAVVVPSLNHGPSTFIWLRSQVSGAGPTTIRVKAWQDGQAEPSQWQFAATNSASQVQGSGSVGLRAYVGSITNAPVVFGFDDFSAEAIEIPGTSPAPTATIASTASPAATPTSPPTPTIPPTPAPPDASTIALDAFGRTVNSGWGSAETGGSYSYYGPQSDFAVANGLGTIRLATPGSTRIAYLPSALGRDVDMTFSFNADKQATGSGLYVYGAVRAAPDGSAYRPKLRILPNGDVYAHVGRQSPSGETSLGEQQRIPGLTFALGSSIRFRTTATGASPTTIRVRAWQDGQPEPTAWHFTATDSSAALQQPGSLRVLAYLSSDATNAPVVMSYDNLAVTSSDPPPAASNVLVGAGDIASCSASTDEATAAILDGLAGTVFTLGDNVYPNATTSEFTNCYNPAWGRHKARTRPVIGNHEYHTSQAAGYFSYFGSAAGQAGQGYHAFDVGSWRIYALNSNCGNVSCAAGSAQEQWLRGDLAANPRQCTAALMHHPRFSSGSHGDHASVIPLWEALHEAGAELVLAGHDHHYERFAPMNPNGSANSAGIHSFVVGTGGIGMRAITAPRTRSLVNQASAHGVLKLTLNAAEYDWQFIPVAGRTFTDSGTRACH